MLIEVALKGVEPTSFPTKTEHMTHVPISILQKHRNCTLVYLSFNAYKIILNTM